MKKYAQIDKNNICFATANLTDDIAAGNPSLSLFLKNGFRIKYQCPKYVRVEISL